MSNWKIRYQERGYVFPKADVVALPIDNSTAEQLATSVAPATRCTVVPRRDLDRPLPLTPAGAKFAR